MSRPPMAHQPDTRDADDFIRDEVRRPENWAGAAWLLVAMLLILLALAVVAGVPPLTAGY